jgi:hypothetical protein
MGPDTGGKTEIFGPIGLANESQNFGLDAQHLDDVPGVPMGTWG